MSQTHCPMLQCLLRKAGCYCHWKMTIDSSSFDYNLSISTEFEVDDWIDTLCISSLASFYFIAWAGRF